MLEKIVRPFVAPTKGSSNLFISVVPANPVTEDTAKLTWTATASATMATKATNTSSQSYQKEEVARKTHREHITDTNNKNNWIEVEVIDWIAWAYPWQRSSPLDWEIKTLSNSVVR